ncbi:MAG: ABC transporter permease [Planctomycetota bacterium]|nr:MAG: ABC transporter permease [Planctomycetota bacterium]REK26114.1 MAG: ABC transporter permease [Planctomycetota bacterium]REK33484.1 MAG: ABC transporter permease [Planctomycetota bacterium]
MKRLLSRYGSVFVLLLLCIYYSIVTISEHQPITPAAGRKLARTIAATHEPAAAVVVIVGESNQDRAFAEAVADELQDQGAQVLETVTARTPADARRALSRIASANPRIDAVATHDPGTKWGPLQPRGLDRLAAEFPSVAGTRVYKPQSYRWPSFLTRGNLLNVINQNADIAIIAIGMTMVIITGGIDLSVGSVLALSGVVTAILLQTWAGGGNASPVGMILAPLAAVGLCTLCGVGTGAVTAIARVPAFVVTLAVMMIGRGLALILAVGYQRSLTEGASATPEAIRIEAAGFNDSGEPFGFAELGNGTLMGVPNPIWLMLALYLAAHVLMTRTRLGRYIYAVGGNPRAAHLSGISVTRIALFVYAVCAALAGLAGVLDASRFVGGRPNAGELYELKVIAAVVVGGTSLSGGEGRVFGTLVGALIIAVIENGLNMSGVASYEQKVVFGGLILAAALLDQLKQRLSAFASPPSPTRSS